MASLIQALVKLGVVIIIMRRGIDQNEEEVIGEQSPYNGTNACNNFAHNYNLQGQMYSKNGKVKMSFAVGVAQNAHRL